MQISMKELVKMGANPNILGRFKAQINGTEKVEVLSLIGEKSIASDFIFLANKTLSREKLIAFACDVALINIDKIKQYTDDFDLIVESLKSRKFTDSVYAAVNAATDNYIDTTVVDAVVNIIRAAHTNDDIKAVYAAYAIESANIDPGNSIPFASYTVHAAKNAGADTDEVNKLLIKLFSK